MDNLKEQYASADNFNKRVTLVNRFSVNKEGFAHWIFNHIELSENATVLELGCGPGYLWSGNIDRIPTNVSVTLTDFSEGMVEVAKARLSAHSGIFKFAVADAQQIPFADGTFDIVIANHMLYHVPDRTRALSEIQRVLKPGGVLYASTVGTHNFKEIRELFRTYFSFRQNKNVTVADAFGLENGEEQLSRFFKVVRLEAYPNQLKVTEAQPIIDYIFSSSSPRLLRFMTPERIVSFKEYLENLIRNEEFISVTKSSGLFIAH